MEERRVMEREERRVIEKGMERRGRERRRERGKRLIAVLVRSFCSSALRPG